MTMEHRWGERIDANIAVVLRTAGGVVAGQMVNVSKSGALIRIAIELSLGVRINLVINGHEVSAYVVRHSAGGGMGVEWCGVAPIGITPAARALPARESQGLRSDMGARRSDLSCQ